LLCGERWRTCARPSTCLCGLRGWLLRNRRGDGWMKPARWSGVFGGTCQNGRRGGGGGGGGHPSGVLRWNGAGGHGGGASQDVASLPVGTGRAGWVMDGILEWVLWRMLSASRTFFSRTNRCAGRSTWFPPPGTNREFAERWWRCCAGPACGAGFRVRWLSARWAAKCSSGARVMPSRCKRQDSGSILASGNRPEPRAFRQGRINGSLTVVKLGRGGGVPSQTRRAQ